MITSNDRNSRFFECPSCAYDIDRIRCFHCGDFMTDPAIVWRGGAIEGIGIQIMLHPRCAIDFMIRLMRDVHEIQCVTGDRFGNRES